MLTELTNNTEFDLDGEFARGLSSFFSYVENKVVLEEGERFRSDWDYAENRRRLSVHELETYGEDGKFTGYMVWDADTFSDKGMHAAIFDVIFQRESGGGRIVGISRSRSRDVGDRSEIEQRILGQLTAITNFHRQKSES